MERKNRILRNFLKSILLIFCICTHAQDVSDDIAYIKTYAAYAVEEMELYKIPASITLAQGLLETAYGQSELAKNANNHFGIKCKKEWTGETYRYTDDAYKECFRKYNHPKESYRDHSIFLAERPYYVALFTLDIKDYKAWSHGLKKAGYATNPKYAELLISRIEKYNLNRFDYLQSEEVSSRINEWYPTLTEAVEVEEEREKIIIESSPTQIVPIMMIQKKNELKQIPVKPLSNAERRKRHATGNYYIEVLEGETVFQIAKNFKMDAARLMKYNELKTPNELLAGQNFFFSRKKKVGAKNFYEVKVGDSMYMISQKEGIKQKKLYKLNRMRKGTQPKPGNKLRLR